MRGVSRRNSWTHLLRSAGHTVLSHQGQDLRIKMQEIMSPGSMDHALLRHRMLETVVDQRRNEHPHQPEEGPEGRVTLLIRVSAGLKSRLSDLATFERRSLEQTGRIVAGGVPGEPGKTGNGVAHRPEVPHLSFFCGKSDGPRLARLSRSTFSSQRFQARRHKPSEK